MGNLVVVTPQIYLVVILWPRCKQNNITNKKIENYSQIFVVFHCGISKLYTFIFSRD